jgi:hypothetical protein
MPAQTGTWSPPFSHETRTFPAPNNPNATDHLAIFPAASNVSYYVDLIGGIWAWPLPRDAATGQILQSPYPFPTGVIYKAPTTCSTRDTRR